MSSGAPPLSCESKTSDGLCPYKGLGAAQQVRLSHILLQAIWQAASSTRRLLIDELVIEGVGLGAAVSTVWEVGGRVCASSGCSVAEWMP